MTLGIPAQFPPLLLSRALSRQLFVYAAFCLITAEVSLVAMGVHAGAWPVLRATASLVVTGIVLTALMFMPPNRWLAAVYLAAGGLSLYFVATAVLASVPGANTTALVPFALVSLAVILASATAVSVRGRVLWAAAGLIASMLSLWAAAAVTDGEFRPDARTLIGALAVMGFAFIVPGQVTVATKAQAAFEESLVEIEEDGARASMGREAVARLHDTLLADVTVLTKIKPGPLSKDVREILEMELAHLVSTDWLMEAIEKHSVAHRGNPTDSPAVDQFLTAIDASSSHGLVVNVSGDIAALNPLSSEASSALAGAVTQCLSNVTTHAGVLNVDVVVLGSGDVVTITVIDGGVGFEPDAVEADRLGVRVSVRSRIESVDGVVKIWSVPGQGTAIMLQLPYGAPA